MLETLVVDDEARGAGVGQSSSPPRASISLSWASRVMKISVIAGSDGALRFYQREGAVDFVTTLVMPVSYRHPTPPAGSPALYSELCQGIEPDPLVNSYAQTWPPG